MEAIEAWVEADLMDLGAGDPAWPAAIDNVLAILASYDDPDCDDLIQALEDINFRPTTEDAGFSLAQGSTYWFTFAPYYDDPDGDELKPLIVTQPEHGELIAELRDLTNKRIRVEYQPDQGYSGPDTFTWKAKERYTTELYKSTPPATVTITVTAE